MIMEYVGGGELFDFIGETVVALIEGEGALTTLVREWAREECCTLVRGLVGLLIRGGGGSDYMSEGAGGTLD